MRPTESLRTSTPRPGEFALKSPTLRRLNKNQIVDCAEPYELQNEVGSVGLRTLGICVTSTEATRANEDLVLKMLMLENIFCTWPPPDV